MNILNIIKKAPKDHVYYCMVVGDCNCIQNDDENYPIGCYVNHNLRALLTSDGKMFNNSPDTECILFPSRDNRDWEAFERVLDGVETHHMLSQSFNSTPKIVWDDNAKKIIKKAEKWQREIEKIEKHWKEVELMIREMTQRINEIYKEYQRRNNYDKKTD